MAASMRTSVCCSTSGCGFGAIASVATDLMTSRQSSLWLHRNNLGASGVAAWKQSHYLLCKTCSSITLVKQATVLMQVAVKVRVAL
jgi:hypothetical protein